MSYPPIFSVCSADATVKGLIGSSPVRLFLFGNAPQNVVTPYVLWQTIGGNPDNFLSGSPDVDSYTLQVDVYGDTASSVRAVADALRDAIESHANVVSWRGDSFDADTQKFRLSFDIDWFVAR